MAIGIDGSFSSPLNRTQATAAVTQLIPAVGSLEASLQLVEKFLQADSSFLQLHDLLKASTSLPTVSGLQDVDYPNLNDFQPTLRSLSNLTALSTIPLPAVITEQFGYMQQNCEMGLLPEIRRAWLTIDSNIFLWAYDNGSDVAYYDGLTETILGVGLIKPRPGVFKEHIKYLLCLTTAVEILLLGVTFSDETGDINDLLLVPEPIFSLSSDDVAFSVITGTAKGRVFLGGKDGCLYEISYQAQEGWFSRKCKKVNHSRSALSFLVPSFFAFGEEDPLVQIAVDDSRHLLYTRSAKGVIELFDLGEYGEDVYRIASRNLNSIVQQASNVAKNIDVNNFKPIVHIDAIEEFESAHINLIATTEAGIRLYFSTTNMMRGSQRATGLHLVHIRLPPGYSACSSIQRVSHVHVANCRRGACIMVSTQNDGKDALWSLISDPFPFEAQLMELFSIVPLNSKVWKTVEERKPPLVKQYTLVNEGRLNQPIAIEPPLLVTQEMEQQRKFVYLSSQGIHIGHKPRPVDHFKQLLIDNQGFDNEPVKGFFILYKDVQACAIALTLACNAVSPQEKQIAEWATLAFFRYGSEAQIVPQPQSPQYNPRKVQISTPVNNTVQPSFAGISSPITPFSSPLKAQHDVITPQEQMDVLQFQRQDQAIKYSNKHSSLYLYFSRLLRPIWSYHVVKSQIANTFEGARECLVSSIPANELTVYIEKLSNLQKFLENNVQFLPTVDAPTSFSFSHISQAPVINVQAYERSSLNYLLHLIKGCLEILGLWKLLYDHQFHTIAALLPPENQMQLKNMTFRDLITVGHYLCALLASALVQKYIEDCTTTDIISQKLNEACPSIFKQENALHAKAHEMIIKARELTHSDERQLIVDEAVQLFKRIGARINLQQACELLESVGAYMEIVDLCINTATLRDEKSLGLYFHKNGKPAEDVHGRTIYNSRMECYNILLSIYERLVQQSKSLIQPGAASPRAHQQPSTKENITLSPDQANDVANTILQKAMNSADELLHITVYDWLYEHRMNDVLLSIKSTYLEYYLKAKANNTPDSIQLLDLLWMYYEKIGHFRAAAHILDKLAERHGNEIVLHQRLEYLSRAIVCMKSCHTHLSKFSETGDFKTSGEFLHELEEKMEVALIQLQILEAIKTLPESQLAMEAINRLNMDLLDISNLYESFADRFDLPECQLAIVYAAGHHDPALIERLWEKIIEKIISNNVNKPTSVIRLMISNKLRSLAKFYLSSDRCFPIASIVRCVESRIQNSDSDPSWLCQCLLSAGINVPKLFDIYHKLYKSKESVSSWPRKDAQLLQVLIWILTQFCDNPSLVAPLERKLFITKSLDVVSGYLLDFQAMNISDPSVRNTISSLRNLQMKIERMSV